MAIELSPTILANVQVPQPDLPRRVKKLWRKL
jgi:hypothetical protein